MNCGSPMPMSTWPASGGLGEHTPVPAWLWRVALLLLALSGGAGLAVYAVLWYFMPEPQEVEDSDTIA